MASLEKVFTNENGLPRTMSREAVGRLESRLCTDRLKRTDRFQNILSTRRIKSSLGDFFLFLDNDSRSHH